MNKKLQSVYILLPSGTIANNIFEVNYNLDSNYTRCTGIALCTPNITMNPNYTPLEIGVRKSDIQLLDMVPDIHINQGISVSPTESYYEIDTKASGQQVTIQLKTLVTTVNDIPYWFIFRLER